MLETFSSTTERPPMRLAEPGRICSEVIPPARAVRKPGSCGQTECSAQTFGVAGGGGPLASGVAPHAGARIAAQVRMHINQAGSNPVALAVDDAGSCRRLQVLSDRLDLAIN